jgi:hypothetical protein
VTGDKTLALASLAYKRTPALRVSSSVVVRPGGAPKCAHLSRQLCWVRWSAALVPPTRSTPQKISAGGVGICGSLATVTGAAASRKPTGGTGLPPAIVVPPGSEGTEEMLDWLYHVLTGLTTTPVELLIGGIVVFAWIAIDVHQYIGFLR